MLTMPSPAHGQPTPASQSRRDPSPSAEGAALWALFGNRLGDNRTIEALAGAACLPWTGMRLRFNPAGALPNLRRGGSLFTLTGPARALLADAVCAGGWPEMVVTSGKRAVPVALWVRAASGGHTRLVHVGRPQAPLGWFDLIVTTPQYGLPDRPNVLRQRFPPTALGPARPVRPDLAGLRAPRLMAIAGGSPPPQIFDADAARRFAAEALARAEASGGSLLFATSPRTSRTAVAALRAGLAGAATPVRLTVFGEGPDDYRAFLDAADGFLVTNDSVSMTTEAAATGAPVALFRLPERPGPAMRLATAALRAESGPASRVSAAGVNLGLITGNRDIAGYMRGLESDGLLAGGGRARHQMEAELCEAARHVRALTDVDV